MKTLTASLRGMIERRALRESRPPPPRAPSRAPPGPRLRRAWRRRARGARRAANCTLRLERRRGRRRRRARRRHHEPRRVSSRLRRHTRHATMDRDITHTHTHHTIYLHVSIRRGEQAAGSSVVSSQRRDDGDTETASWKSSKQPRQTCCAKRCIRAPLRPLLHRAPPGTRRRTTARPNRTATA